MFQQFTRQAVNHLYTLCKAILIKGDQEKPYMYVHGGNLSAFLHSIE